MPEDTSTMGGQGENRTCDLLINVQKPDFYKQEIQSTAATTVHQLVGQVFKSQAVKDSKFTTTTLINVSCDKPKVSDGLVRFFGTSKNKT